MSTVVPFGLTLLSSYRSQFRVVRDGHVGRVTVGRGEYRACKPPTSRVPLTVVLGLMARKSRKFMVIGNCVPGGTCAV